MKVIQKEKLLFISKVIPVTTDIWHVITHNSFIYLHKVERIKSVPRITLSMYLLKKNTTDYLIDFDSKIEKKCILSFEKIQTNVYIELV